MNFSATGEPYLLTSSRGSSFASGKESCQGLMLGRLIYSNIYLITHMTVIRRVFVGKQV